MEGGGRLREGGGPPGHPGQKGASNTACSNTAISHALPKCRHSYREGKSIHTETSRDSVTSQWIESRGSQAVGLPGLGQRTILSPSLLSLSLTLSLSQLPYFWEAQTTWSGPMGSTTSKSLRISAKIQHRPPDRWRIDWLLDWLKMPTPSLQRPLSWYWMEETVLHALQIHDKNIHSGSF